MQGSSLTFDDSGFNFGMGFRPPSSPAPVGVLGSALIQKLLPSRFSVGASWNRMNAGYEPETTTQGSHIVSISIYLSDTTIMFFD